MLAISIVIMASGFSERMGQNKLFLTFKNDSFIKRAFDMTNRYPFYERILVISANNKMNLEIPKDIKVVINSQPEIGQNKSVQLGSQAATGDGILFLPIDQPLLDEILLTEILLKAKKDNIVYPIDENGKPNSPVYFGQKFQEELNHVSGVGGGKSIRNKYPNNCVEVPVSIPENLFDIDTPKDYKWLLNHKGS